MGKFKKQPTALTKSTPQLPRKTELKPKGIHRLAKVASQSLPPVKVTETKKEYSDFTFPKRVPKPEKVTKTPGKGKVKRLTKKERQNVRKEDILKRIQATQSAFIEDKARGKREKTEIIKDVKPLLDALPSLDSVFKFKNKNDKLKTGVLAYDKSKGKLLVKQEIRDQKAKEFQEKIQMHKNLLQNFTALTPQQRIEVIREATRQRKLKLQNAVEEQDKME